MKTHELKCWPEPFQALLDGIKHHEVRDVTDRDFRVGDELELREYVLGPDNVYPTTGRFTGRVIAARVTYISQGGNFGLPLNLCVMSVAVVGRVDA
jgi:hypothetical protein